jgi:hypothetical protein
MSSMFSYVLKPFSVHAKYDSNRTVFHCDKCFPPRSLFCKLIGLEKTQTKDSVWFCAVTLHWNIIDILLGNKFGFLSCLNAEKHVFAICYNTVYANGSIPQGALVSYNSPAPTLGRVLTRVSTWG